MTSRRTYTASSERASRTTSLNRPSVFRDDQRYIELHASSDLSRRSVLRLLPPLRRSGRDSPCICIIGDGALLDDDQLAKQQDCYRQGILRAAYALEAHIIDNGLGSSVAVLGDSDAKTSDFSRNVLHIGISPRCEGKDRACLSQYTTHQIVLRDFTSWNDRPAQFVREKFNFVRRLNGATCRAVCVLFNEGPAAFEEVAEACRLGFPVICMKGSSGLADELASAQLEYVGGSARLEDPDLQRIVDSRCIYVFDSNEGRNCDLASLIRCHCLTDVVTMTRLINDLDPVAARIEGTVELQFDGGPPSSRVMSRVGKEGTLKSVDFERGKRREGTGRRGAGGIYGAEAGARMDGRGARAYRDESIAKGLNFGEKDAAGRVPAVSIDARGAQDKDAGAGGKLDVYALFESWDDNQDGSLSVLEIVRGLRGGNTNRGVTRRMIARIMWYLEDLTNSGQDPDWDFKDREEFWDLLNRCPPSEATDPTGFLEAYGDVALSDRFLPNLGALALEKPQEGIDDKHKKKDAVPGNRIVVPNAAEISSEGYDDTADVEIVKSRVERVFESWDADDDGSLSVLEIKRALERERADEESLLKEKEIGKVVEYMAKLESSGENLEWQYLDLKEFQEITWA